MDIDFGKDLKEGLAKIVEISTWLLDCLKVEVGRNLQQWKKEKSKVVEIESNDNPEQKEVEVKTNYKNVYQRKDGRWEYVKSINGTKFYFIASTKTKLLEKIKEAKTNGKMRQEKKKKQETLISWAYKWLDIYKRHDISVHSIDRYERVIRCHLVPYFKDMELKNVKPETVQRLINSITAERSREYIFLTVKQILKTAFINHKIKEDISSVLIKPRRKSKPNRTALDIDQQTALLEEIQKRDADIRMFILFSLVLGTRRVETCRFKLSDITEDKNRLFINGSKTESSRRTIKISDEMIQLLKDNAVSSPNELYFQRKEMFYTHEVKNILRDIGADDKTLHDLRHTCSTNMYYLGVSDKQRQQVLGHSTIIMTNDIYTNLQEDIDEKSLIKLYNNLYFRY